MCECEKARAAKPDVPFSSHAASIPPVAPGRASTVRRLQSSPRCVRQTLPKHTKATPRPNQKESSQAHPGAQYAPRDNPADADTQDTNPTPQSEYSERKSRASENKPRSLRPPAGQASGQSARVW